MPNFTSYADLIAEMTASGKTDRLTIYKKLGNPTVTLHTWVSWCLGGIGHPQNIAVGAGGSATPGAGGTALTSSPGTIFYPNVSPDNRYLLAFGGIHCPTASSTGVTVKIYDRLVNVGGVSLGAVTTNINSVALPRYTSGLGVECWMEISTAGTGVASVNISSYTNEAGTTGKVGGVYTSTSTGTANEMHGPLPLAAGDMGIRSIQTFTSPGPGGLANLVLLKPLATILIPPNQWTEQDFVYGMWGLPQVFDGASLTAMSLSPANSAGYAWLSVTTGWG